MKVYRYVMVENGGRTENEDWIMKLSLSLRAKIIMTVAVMSLVTFGGGITIFWYSYQVDNEYRDIVQNEVVLYKLACDMELALANQKGFLTYYLIDGDLKWLDSFGQYRQKFLQGIDQAAGLAHTPNQVDAINDIASRYRIYMAARNSAVEEYRRKQTVAVGSISSLHEKQRDMFFTLLDRCQEFSRKQWQLIEGFRLDNITRSTRLRASATIALSIWGGFLLLLLYILYRNILSPIRGLALQTGGSVIDSSRNEVDSLSQSLKGIMRVFDETSGELEKSRKHLQHAERMAMVGELAAGVAHTIRNPFTSIKMRMFSLNRSLSLNEDQQDDFRVISDEIGRIDKIVQNFLEFSRPPKLQLKKTSLSHIMSSVMVLLEFRLKSYDVELYYSEEANLPPLCVDADRMKEALVNLVTNSCEALEGGGKIEIKGLRETDPVLGEVIAIAVRDSGPGIPEELIHKVTAPFFTTKEEGSGLGLSIVKRIVQEHGGGMRIVSAPDSATQIILILPVKGESDVTGDTDR